MSPSPRPRTVALIGIAFVVLTTAAIAWGVQSGHMLLGQTPCYSSEGPDDTPSHVVPCTRTPSSSVKYGCLIGEGAQCISNGTPTGMALMGIGKVSFLYDSKESCLQQCFPVCNGKTATTECPPEYSESKCVKEGSACNTKTCYVNQLRMGEAGNVFADAPPRSCGTENFCCKSDTKCLDGAGSETFVNGTCKSITCGNGKPDPGEECDPGRALLVDIAIANKVGDPLNPLTDKEVKELQKVDPKTGKSCLSTCKISACSDGIDNDKDASIADKGGGVDDKDDGCWVTKVSNNSVSFNQSALLALAPNQQPPPNNLNPNGPIGQIAQLQGEKQNLKGRNNEKDPNCVLPQADPDAKDEEDEEDAEDEEEDPDADVKANLLGSVSPASSTLLAFIEPFDAGDSCGDNDDCSNGKYCRENTVAYDPSTCSMPAFDDHIVQCRDSNGMLTDCTQCANDRASLAPIGGGKDGGFLACVDNEGCSRELVSEGYIYVSQIKECCKKSAAKNLCRRCAQVNEECGDYGDSLCCDYEVLEATGVKFDRRDIRCWGGSTGHGRCSYPNKEGNGNVIGKDTIPECNEQNNGFKPPVTPGVPGGGGSGGGAGTTATTTGGGSSAGGNSSGGKNAGGGTTGGGGNSTQGSSVRTSSNSVSTSISSARISSVPTGSIGSSARSSSVVSSSVTTSISSRSNSSSISIFLVSSSSLASIPSSFTSFSSSVASVSTSSFGNNSSFSYGNSLSFSSFTYSNPSYSSVPYYAYSSESDYSSAAYYTYSYGYIPATYRYPPGAPPIVIAQVPQRFVPQNCGDGLPNAGEECDDGIQNSNMPTSRCRTDCRLAGCGDGITDTPRETCDDGNGMNGDGCSEFCQYERAAPNILQGNVLQLPLMPGQSYPLSGPTIGNSLYTPPQTTKSGPAALAVMAAGASAGFSWMKRKKKIS